MSSAERRAGTAITGARDVPPPESAGGWRRAAGPEEVSALGFDPASLVQVGQRQLLFDGGESWSLIVVRHGVIALELHTFNVLPRTRFDIWSGTKAFTSAAWGMLPGAEGATDRGLSRGLDTTIYDLIPAGHPLSDVRKAAITVRHILSMTSGIPGERSGVIGMQTPPTVGSFEHALGRAPNAAGLSVARLAAAPGERWDYSDPAYVHLALAFSTAAGMELDDYLAAKLFGPIGIEEASWDRQGGGGFLGPHTNAHTGLHLSARELARFGYLMLHGGRWGERQLIPSAFVAESTRSATDLNPEYGWGWWVNGRGRRWPGAPSDAFALAGYRSNRAYVVPSLDLVVVRVGSGPASWEERAVIEGVVSAIVD